MRKKHNFYIFPLIFEKMTDFHVNKAAKWVRVPPFFLRYSDADGYGAFAYKITKKILIKLILPINFIGTVGNVLKYIKIYHREVFNIYCIQQIIVGGFFIIRTFPRLTTELHYKSSLKCTINICVSISEWRFSWNKSFDAV